MKIIYMKFSLRENWLKLTAITDLHFFAYHCHSRGGLGGLRWVGVGWGRGGFYDTLITLALIISVLFTSGS